MEAGEPLGPPVPGSVGAPGRKGKDDAHDAHDEQVPGRGQQAPGVTSTVAYYLLLFAGAYGFTVGLWTLTESSNTLASFGEK